MNYYIHGTCGHCGGAVGTPRMWMGILPPIPECLRCGARIKLPHGMVLEMEETQKKVRAEIEVSQDDLTKQVRKNLS